MIYLMIIDGEENKRKFVRLYEKYRYLMLNIAEQILKDRYLAEDAVHESFIKVAQNMSDIGEIEELRTKRYLIVVTKNSSIDIYRKRSRQIEKEIYFDEIGDFELSIIQDEEENQNVDIIRQLPIKYRDVFLLKYSSEYSNKDIARILGITEGNVRQRLLRGKELIKKQLERGINDI